MSEDDKKSISEMADLVRDIMKSIGEITDIFQKVMVRAQGVLNIVKDRLEEENAQLKEALRRKYEEN